LNPEGKYRLIGSGSRYAKTFLERILNRDMTMAKVAEIGYLVIQYIEELRLDHTVGLDTSGPQIWFIPDHIAENIAQNERKKDVVRQADNQEMNDFAEHVKKRLDNYNKFIDGLFFDS
jgi:20S proteasome alpha/beta subunit